MIALTLVAGCVRRAPSGDPIPSSHVLARSEIAVGINAPIRVLPNGNVLVSDDYGTRLWMLDSRLANARVIGDTSAATGRFIPGVGYYIRPYVGDSSLLVRAGIGDGFVLDGTGRKVREVAPRAPQGRAGEPCMDLLDGQIAKSGIVMGIMLKPRQRTSTIDSLYVVRGSCVAPVRPDTVAVITRDVAASATSFIPAGDGAAMLSDGTIAIGRAKDYSIDWIAPDGRRWSQPLKHQWTILSPADKQAALDSLRRSLGARADGAKMPLIPDTVPALSWIGLFRADAENRVWIEQVIVPTNPYRPARRGTYDLVDRQGKVVRRVHLPPPAVIKAFGPGRVYYVLRVNGVSRLNIGATPPR